MEDKKSGNMYIDELSNSLQNLIKRKPTLEEIGEALGISKQAVSNRKAQKYNFPDYEIKQIIDYFVKKYDVQDFTSLDNDSVPVCYRPNVYLSAGYGIEILDETKETMLIDKRLLITDRGNNINPQNCEIVRISGNSMSPEYKHGDRVIIDKGDTDLLDGHIFAFRYKGSCYVKEINMLGDKIKCLSLNKDYDPFYINDNEDFIVLGRILPRVRL